MRYTNDHATRLKIPDGTRLKITKHHTPRFVGMTGTWSSTGQRVVTDAGYPAFLATWQEAETIPVQYAYEARDMIPEGTRLRIVGGEHDGKTGVWRRSTNKGSYGPFLYLDDRGLWTARWSLVEVIDEPAEAPKVDPPVRVSYENRRHIPLGARLRVIGGPNDGVAGVWRRSRLTPSDPMPHFYPDDPGDTWIASPWSTVEMITVAPESWRDKVVAVWEALDRLATERAWCSDYNDFARARRVSSLTGTKFMPDETASIPLGTKVKITRHAEHSMVGTLATWSGSLGMRRADGTAENFWVEAEVIEEVRDWKKDWDNLWKALLVEAQARGWGDLYDQFAAANGGPARTRSFVVQVTISNTVTATSGEAAREIAEKALREFVPNGWSTRDIKVGVKED